MNSTPANLEQTVIIAPPGGRRAAAKPHQAIGFVEGSHPDFTSELNNLLRDRLRLATLILFFGYLAFLLKFVLLPKHHWSSADTAQTWMLLTVTAINGVVAWRLCVNCTHVLKHLRFVESVVFVSSALLFLVSGYANVLSSSVEGHLPAIAVPWLMLIFTYAIFIPNPWKRALVRIIPLALAPPAILLIAQWTSRPAADLMRNNPAFQYQVLEAAMMMTLAATIAVWGIKSIGALRSQAYEAKRMGQYQLKRLLGRGGMGEVYLAEHLMLKRPCAIKLIRPERAGDPSTLARFEQEVQATARLTHWNSVEIYDFGRAEDGTFYYVMEYLPGLSLDQLVEKGGAMPASRVIHLLSQTCDALAEAHQQQMIHRDIKPGNIFAAKRGGAYDTAKLLDFGLVRTLDTASDLRLTQEGAVTGSPLYMSPEQASGDIADARSDIYALGCVAYYLLTGRPPFEENNAVKLILAHAQKTPVLPSTYVKDLPRDIEQVVMTCLEKAPERRYQSVESLRQALMSCQDAGGWTREMAEQWWTTCGCAKKRALDEHVLEGRNLELESTESVPAAFDLVNV